VIASLAPRAVLVRRLTEYELLLEEHGTPQQAQFYIEHQGESFEHIRRRDTRQKDAFATAKAGIPRTWRSVEILRSELSRFVFERRDIVVAIGQDGLVANVAKYLDGQPLIGVNPDPALYDGSLVPHAPDSVQCLLMECAEHRARIESRTMVEALLDDGQRLLALNEIFIGQRTHQSARYRIVLGGHEERQSSSGIIVATGTGSTGWARSINLERDNALVLPAPEDLTLAFFVREAFPGSGFSVNSTMGLLQASEMLGVLSEMHEGVIFGDAIEDDRLEFSWGKRVSVRSAHERLQFVA